MVYSDMMLCRGGGAAAGRSLGMWWSIEIRENDGALTVPPRFAQVRSVGNNAVLGETAHVEAFNLKAAIDFQVRH